MSDPDMTLPSDRWPRIKELFGSALARPAAERRAFLDQACGPTEGDIRREVETLLAAHQTSDSFLATPAAPVAGPATSHGGALAEGQILGPYRVLRTLGQGGMATVYLAHDERHRRSVALKVLRPELAARARTRALPPRDRDRRPAAIIRTSCRCYDSGEADGVLYYVMPFVEGESLRAAARARAAAPDRRRPADRPRGRRRRWSYAHSPQHRSTATSSRRTSCSTRARRWWPTSGSPGR